MGAKRRKQRKKNGKPKVWQAPKGTNVHHRLPRSRGGSSNASNLSVVPKRLHNMYNELFGSNPTAHEVAEILTETWIDPAYHIIVMRKGGNMIQCPVCCTPMSKDGKEYTCSCGVKLIIGGNHEDNNKNVLSTSPQQREPAQSTTEVSSENDCHLGHA